MLCDAAVSLELYSNTGSVLTVNSRQLLTIFERD